MFLQTMRGSVANVNTTLTANNVAQLIQAKNPARTVIQIQNTSAISMWIRFGAVDAAADAGILITAGSTWTSPPNYCPIDRLTIVGATAGSKFNYWIK